MGRKKKTMNTTENKKPEIEYGSVGSITAEIADEYKSQTQSATYFLSPSILRIIEIKRMCVSDVLSRIQRRHCRESLTVILPSEIDGARNIINAEMKEWQRVPTGSSDRNGAARKLIESVIGDALNAMWLEIDRAMNEKQYITLNDLEVAALRGIE